MDPKPQKPPFLFTSPFSVWTELAFKLWGFGKAPERSTGAEKEVAVAVIPTRDSAPKRTKAKVRSKTKSKRARR